jgi:hypothetical protein
MFNKKIASIVLATAMSLGTVSAATAATIPGVPDSITSVLTDLVSKKTISQDQADAIIAAYKAAQSASAAAPVKPSVGVKPSISGAGGGEGHEGMEGGAMGGLGAHDAARQAVITSFLGTDAAGFRAARIAGKSLATLATTAGKTPAALIDALVNYDSIQIDGAVKDHRYDLTKATKLKANLKARITAEVNRVGGPEGSNERGKLPARPGKTGTPSN